MTPDAPEFSNVRDDSSRLISAERQFAILPADGCTGQAVDPYYGLLLNVLNRVGCGAAVLDEVGHIVDLNETASRLLGGHDAPGNANDLSMGPQHNEVIHAAAMECARGRAWVTVERNTGRPIVMKPVATTDGRAGTLVLIIDLNSGMQPTPETLKRLFGLTSAEAKLAAGLAAGCSTSELATRLRVARSTIRSQLASIYSKTDTRRQGELVSLLSRVSFLP